MGTLKAVGYEDGAGFSASPAFGAGAGMRAEAAVTRSRRERKRRHVSRVARHRLLGGR
jgi:hypothetical protein